MPVDLQNLLPPDQSLKVPLGDIHLTKSERRALCRLKAGKQPDRNIGERLCSTKLAHFDHKAGLYAITPNGERWLDFNGASRSNVRWERGLAIASIIISIASLLLAGLSLYLQARSGLQ